MSQHQHDPAFDVIPQGKTYFFVWRVKNFELVAVPPEEYGTFFEGDSYIVICCCENRKDGHSKMESVDLKEGQRGFVDIHFWIGSGSSQDEAGVAAFKTVELDDFLGGFPVQHRETEGNESSQFLGYFRSGMRLCKGGFESGFNKVVDELQPALFQVKGKKRPVMTELSEISWKAMNDGDVFILVAKKFIFVWTGSKSNHMERIAGNRIANEMKNELSRFKLSVVIIEDGEEEKNLAEDELEDFASFLPLESKSELRISEGGSLEASLSDQQFESVEPKFVKLYRVREQENGQIETEHVKDGPLSREDLDSNDTFIVDNGEAGIWVWVGKDATKKERSSGLKYGLELVKQENYPAHTEVRKVVEHGEPVEFKALFQAWVTPFRAAEPHKEARLFRLTQKGRFQQVAGFDRDDLEEDSFMILDVGNRIWIWLSDAAQEKIPDEERQRRLGRIYLKQDRSGRPMEDDQIVLVKQGQEPEEFTSCFPNWE